MRRREFITLLGSAAAFWPLAAGAQQPAALTQVMDELAREGVLLSGATLLPSVTGARYRKTAGKRVWTDGPFTESKELVAGFWLWECASLKEAIEWVKRCPNPMLGDSEIEIRQIFSAEDFGAEFTPELREKEDRLRAEMGSRKKKS